MARHATTGPATREQRALAARIKAKGTRATPNERAWLLQYTREREHYSATRKDATRNRATADTLARGLAEWFGVSLDKARTVDDLEYDYAVELRFPSTPFSGERSDKIDLPKSEGRYTTISVQIGDGPRAGKWTTIVASTDNWDDAGFDFQEEIDEALDSYGATEISAISIIVR